MSGAPVDMKSIWSFVFANSHTSHAGLLRQVNFLVQTTAACFSDNHENSLTADLVFVSGGKKSYGGSPHLAFLHSLLLISTSAEGKSSVFLCYTQSYIFLLDKSFKLLEQCNGWF